MLRIFMLAAAAVLGFTGMASAQYPWKPDKPITVIVPWAAGGSTDQVIAHHRRRDREGARPEGRRRQSAAARPARSAPRTCSRRRRTATPGPSGAAKDIGTYVVSGLLDTKIADWRLYLVVVNVSVLGVNPNSPYKTAADLVAAMKAKPGQVSVATAGVNSSGHAAIEAFTRALGLTYKHVTYDGGNPAVNATVAGETEVTTQLAVEQANMLRAKRLRRARGALRPAARARRLRHHPAGHRVRSRASSPTPTISASSCQRTSPPR